MTMNKISLEEAQVRMKALRESIPFCRDKEEILHLLGTTIWGASGLLILTKEGQVIPNPDIVGTDHGIEPLPVRVKITRSRKA